MAGRAQPPTQRRAEERHMLVLVASDLGANCRIEPAPEPYLAAAFHAPVLPVPGSFVGEPMPVHGVGVELRLQVLQVQREVKNRAVGDRVCLTRRRR